MTGSCPTHGGAMPDETSAGERRCRGHGGPAACGVTADLAGRVDGCGARGDVDLGHGNRAATYRGGSERRRLGPELGGCRVQLGVRGDDAGGRSGSGPDGPEADVRHCVRSFRGGFRVYGSGALHRRGRRGPDRGWSGRRGRDGLRWRRSCRHLRRHGAEPCVRVDGDDGGWSVSRSVQPWWGRWSRSRVGAEVSWCSRPWVSRSLLVDVGCRSPGRRVPVSTGSVAPCS